MNTSSGAYRIGGGPNTASIVCGGLPTSANTETWNGTSWTEVNDLNSGRYAHGGGGTQSSLLVFGGDSPPTVCEDWNGASWSEVADLNTGRDPYGQGTGNTSNALCISGFVPPAAVTTVEEWSGSSDVIKVLTD